MKYTLYMETKAANGDTHIVTVPFESTENDVNADALAMIERDLLPTLDANTPAIDGNIVAKAYVANARCDEIADFEVARGEDGFEIW